MWGRERANVKYQKTFSVGAGVMEELVLSLNLKAGVT